jgi:hypothetical protein
MITGSYQLFGDRITPHDKDYFVGIYTTKFFWCRQYKRDKDCIFEWNMNRLKSEILNKHKEIEAMASIKFLNKEIADLWGITPEDIADLYEAIKDRFDAKHRYSKFFFESVIKNKSWQFSEETINLAKKSYLEKRKN